MDVLDADYPSTEVPLSSETHYTRPTERDGLHSTEVSLVLESPSEALSELIKLPPLASWFWENICKGQDESDGLSSVLVNLNHPYKGLRELDRLHSPKYPSESENPYKGLTALDMLPSPELTSESEDAYNGLN